MKLDKMKILIKIFALGIMLAGCEVKEKPIKKTTIQIDYGIDMVTIDSCEYLRSQVNLGFVLTHKGNCKYCKQRK